MRYMMAGKVYVGFVEEEFTSGREMKNARKMMC